MENILLPTTIDFQDTDQQNVGTVVITPCHQGYGTTIGNALRRVLLSSLPGAAVESFKINGLQHEFSAIDGVQEDAVEIMLNLKKLAVVCHSDTPVTISLSKKGEGAVTAADFEKNADVEIMNPDLHILHITDKSKSLDMDVTVARGRGYVTVAQKDTKGFDLGTIAVDSLYTPIRDVGYDVELTRVGDVTDYEKLTLTIETNGAISPKEAVAQATQILMNHFTLIIDATGTAPVESNKSDNAATDDSIEEEDAV